MSDFSLPVCAQFKDVLRVNSLQQLVVSGLQQQQSQRLYRYYNERLLGLDTEGDVDKWIVNAAANRARASMNVWEAALCIRAVEKMALPPSLAIAFRAVSPSSQIVEEAQNWVEGIGTALRSAFADPRREQPARMRALRNGHVPRVLCNEMEDDASAFTMLQNASENVTLHSVAQVDAFLLRIMIKSKKRVSLESDLDQIAIVQEHIKTARSWHAAYNAADVGPTCTLGLRP